LDRTVGEMEIVGELRLVLGDCELSGAVFREDVFDYCARLGERWAVIGDERRMSS
jgi:hypothetical protein